ncbi:unnamed protein product, partial [Dicrocoelium dendriticum]
TENSTTNVLNTPRIIHNPQIGSRQTKFATRRNGRKMGVPRKYPALLLFPDAAL